MVQDLLETQLAWWLLLPSVVAGLLLVGELGYRMGLRTRGDSLESKKAQTGLLVGALLALLGLLLAFSFGIVEQRYSERKALVLEDANAIGTTYLRAQLLPSPHGERVQVLLRTYAATRVSPSPATLQRDLKQSERIQSELWAVATSVAMASPESEVVSLFVSSLNELIDLHESRITVALHQRMPAPILLTLNLVSLLAISVVGFSAGLSRWRSLFPTAALVVAVSAVVVLIVELDRPVGGRLFQVSQRAIRDVQQSMRQPANR